MNIGWDFDHTLTRSPHKFFEFIKATSVIGVQHFLITGRRTQDKLTTLKELEAIHSNFSKLFSQIYFYPSDYQVDKVTVDLLKQIAYWKAQICLDIPIHTIFEDSVFIIEAVKRVSPDTIVGLLI